MLLLATLLAGFASTVAADAPTANPPRATLSQAEIAPKRGLFYEIKGDTATVYLFGTLHVGKAEFYPLDARANQALAEAVDWFRSNGYAKGVGLERI